MEGQVGAVRGGVGPLGVAKTGIGVLVGRGWFASQMGGNAVESGGPSTGSRIVERGKRV